MTYLVMFFVLVFAAVIQAVIPTWPFLGETRLPFLLGAVVYYALTRDRGVMLRAAFLAGLFQDALSMIPLGYSSFCFCLLGAFINHYRDILFARQLITHVLLGAVLNVVATIFLYVLLGLGGHVAFVLEWFLLKSMGAALLGAVTVPAVFRGVEELEQRIGSFQWRES